MEGRDFNEVRSKSRKGKSAIMTNDENVDFTHVNTFHKCAHKKKTHFFACCTNVQDAKGKPIYHIK